MTAELVLHEVTSSQEATSPPPEDVSSHSPTEIRPKFFLENAQKIITQQRVVIEKLHKENNIIKDELRAKTIKGPTPAQKKRLDKLADVRQTLLHKIDVERRRADMLEREIDVFEARIVEQRKLMGGTQGPAQSARQTNNHLTVLENRLDKVLQKFSDLINKNKDLRREIDSVQKARLNMEGAYQKLEQSLQACTEELQAARDATDAAMAAQNHMLSRVAALKALEDRELATLKAELQELQRGQRGQKHNSMVSCVDPQDLFEPGTTAEQQESESKEILRCLQSKTGILNPSNIRDYFQAREERNAAMSLECKKLTDQLKQLQKRKAVLVHEVSELENGLGLGIVRDAVKQMRIQTENLCKRTQMLNEKHDETLTRLHQLRESLAAACTSLCLEPTSAEEEDVVGFRSDMTPAQTAFLERNGERVLADLKLLFNQLEAHARIIVHVYHKYVLGTGGDEPDAKNLKPTIFSLHDPPARTHNTDNIESSLFPMDEHHPPEHSPGSPMNPTTQHTQVSVRPARGHSPTLAPHSKGPIVISLMDPAADEAPPETLEQQVGRTLAEASKSVVKLSRVVEEEDADIFGDNVVKHARSPGGKSPKLDLSQKPVAVIKLTEPMEPLSAREEKPGMEEDQHAGGEEENNLSDRTPSAGDGGAGESGQKKAEVQPQAVLVPLNTAGALQACTLDLLLNGQLG